jgi:hypothetical protein
MTNNSRFAALLCSSFGLLLCPIPSKAADWSVTARAETGMEYYRFEQSPILAFRQNRKILIGGNQFTFTGTKTLPSKNFEAWMPILGAGVSVVVDRFFVDASVQAAFNGTDSDSGQAREAISASLTGSPPCRV